jgi:GTP-binding protein LepA
VIVLTRVFEGTIRKGQKIRLMWNGRVLEVETLGVLTPKPVEVEELRAGEVGFLMANSKTVADTKIGDTITDEANPPSNRARLRRNQAHGFAGLYTVDAHEHTQLREALEKLRLNDSSFFFEPESSVALGFGFRCGFLGLLHMEIIQERLERSSTWK